jgi:hypothetical protein
MIFLTQGGVNICSPSISGKKIKKAIENKTLRVDEAMIKRLHGRESGPDEGLGIQEQMRIRRKLDFFIKRLFSSKQEEEHDS